MPSSSAIAKAVDAQHHDYSWTDSHISLLVVVGWLLAAAIFAVVVMLRLETVPPFERQIGLWVVLLLLVSIGMWGQRNSNRRLRSVDVVSDGLWFGGVNQRNSDFCSWASIERVERFSYPDHDAVYVLQKSGLRVISGGRTLFIYEHISDFRGLAETIERKCSGTEPVAPD